MSIEFSLGGRKVSQDSFFKGIEEEMLEQAMSAVCNEMHGKAASVVDPETGKPCSEGFVIRNAKSFETNSGTLPVESNEFNNLMKLVREKHVKTDEHWTKTWKPAELIDYSKYMWNGYEFVNKKKKEVLDFVGAEDIGKIVQYKGEKGVLVRTPSHLEEHIGKICVRWDNKKEDDYEGYYGMPCKFIDDYELKYINADGTLK